MLIPCCFNPLAPFIEARTAEPENLEPYSLNCQFPQSSLFELTKNKLQNNFALFQETLKERLRISQEIYAHLWFAKKSNY